MKTKRSSESEKKCVECGQQADKFNDMFVCTGCFDVIFCSKKCQRRAWNMHRLYYFPCHVCGKRISGVKVNRECQCSKKKGYAHTACLVDAAIEDSGGHDWDFSSTMWEQCRLCGGSFSGDVKESLDNERHSRVAKAKERLKDLLLEVRHCVTNADSEFGIYDDGSCLSYGEVLPNARECVDLCNGIYGVDNWSSEDVFFSHLNFGIALAGCEHVDEAREMLELVQAKLKTCKTERWRLIERTLTLHLAHVYMVLDAIKEALPLFEDLVHKYHHGLGPEQRCCALECLAQCYACLRKWKHARETIEKACKHSKDIRGSDNTITRKLVMTRQDIFQSSYNDAISHGMESIPDGITLEVDDYNTGGLFKVSIKSNEDEISDSFVVPVDQVIMVKDSDVVLHSLKGAKHLNGKLGIITEFNHDIGRYMVIVEGSSKTFHVKPQNLLPAYMGCDKEKMVNLPRGFQVRNRHILRSILNESVL